MDNLLLCDPDRKCLNEIAEALPALVLTGAGVSVATGIPTYRNEAGTWLRSDPITHQEFLKDPRQRQRYWGRSLLGWPAVRDARPATAHRILAQMEAIGAITHIVTQNVDRLHQRAGSAKVTDLHGRLDRAVCLDCKTFISRDQLQSDLLRLNPGITRTTVSARPDGDADLADGIVDSVTVPCCKQCKGTLMPDVVFFGGSIPNERVLEGKLALERARCLLVVGSSLQVYSGYRFCKWARDSNKPIFLINPGLTRADDMATKWRIDADSGLQAIFERYCEHRKEQNLKEQGINSA
ncbi:NAD-dependent protein deacetylase [Congregibacter variabilis]|uniref:protein acetyllysine N-acetyltransferase n=1 Tax=Congregibacter variabilis TaxID=3081200 RepID=A0ABZ0I3X8_9GAMM|nr:NAD-dependent protein deacetylase [Congregibacter sp. IMCC43200]